MPIYDYKCNECDKVKEKLTSSATTHVECPFCGGKMERQISGQQSFYLKGDGFYTEKSMSKVNVRK